MVQAHQRVILRIASIVSVPHVSASKWRSQLVVVLLAGVGMILGLRLIQLQGLRRSEFAAQVARQRTFREVLAARPGDLLDRHGRLFATTVTAPSVFVNPSRISDPWNAASQLAEALELDADKLFERFTSNPEKKFLWIKRRISSFEAERIRQLDLPAGVWGFRDELLRRYPQGTLAAHVIGLRNIDGIGQGGIEQSLDAQLQGTDGWRELVQDARGKVIDVADTRFLAAKPGQRIVLTLDSALQVFAERALDRLVEQWQPKSCSAVVLDPQTGEIWAMASRPTFDPNRPDEVGADAWKNRAISDIYEPGSTLKPCVVAWALQQDRLKPHESFDCEHGEYKMGPRLLHDHHPYDRLNVIDILVKSSNIGMAKIGERLTNRGLFDALDAFGFGRPTGIELPGELAGIVRPLKQWNIYSTGSVPMGQEVAATPLQIIAAYGALANGGRLITPHLVLHVGDDATTSPPVMVSEAVRADIADWVTQQALTEVVRRGTGRKAHIKGYQVFGKTGTAQKPDPATGGYSNERHVSSFICGAPADTPRVLVLVTVDEPQGKGSDQFGGTVAAPVAAEILRNTLVQLSIAPTEKTIRSALK